MNKKRRDNRWYKLLREIDAIMKDVYLDETKGIYTKYRYSIPKKPTIIGNYNIKGERILYYLFILKDNEKPTWLHNYTMDRYDKAGYKGMICYSLEEVISFLEKNVLGYKL